MEVLKYSPPSWLDREGAAKKFREIKRKGIPKMHLWRFTTLTVADRKQHPVDALKRMKRQFRYFIRSVRARYGSHVRWARKLEFHDDGFPHFHVLIEVKHKLDEEEFGFFEKAWALGRVNHQCVGAGKYSNGLDAGLSYIYKYCFKSPWGNGLPDWFADYYVPARHDKNGECVRPESFSRTRFWQTSQGFYTGTPPESDQEEKEPRKSYIVEPARRGMERVQNSIIVRVIDDNGKVKASKRLDFTHKVWDKLAAWETVMGNAALLGKIVECSALTLWRVITNVEPPEQNQKQWIKNQIRRVTIHGHSPDPRARPLSVKAAMVFESWRERCSMEPAFNL